MGTIVPVLCSVREERPAVAEPDRRVCICPMHGMHMSQEWLLRYGLDVSVSVFTGLLRSECWGQVTSKPLSLT